ncbi:uncharacterized protein PV06_00272 [Exophiala oligosperma]|uniref:Fcf2 pre-rRNA processing C-terminal domain-containing protein n=2 Tax=Chaetothyriales TaxID=34395 RepID=A0A0D2B5Q5_9EURO|nr:uncharacterized protein PV06_00272 [Exophiala oligosperma]KAJ9647561.1 dTDP-fucopyranose mutase [Knufia peltigerae]KIW47586.1 hypothetical protein PV06_00272 [Exophiala oligosperma]
MAKLLDDVEIDRLLSEAEERLRAKAAAPETSTSTEISLHNGELEKASSRKLLPKLQHNLNQTIYIKDHSGVAQANPQLAVGKDQRQLADSLKKVELPGKSKRINDQVSAGPKWFDLPKTNLTPQLKRDLQLIEMRSVLDPHRHYKKNTRKGKIPTFSQTGTVIEGPTEFFSARINKKDRSNNFVDEAMTVEQETGRFKRKYAEIQDSKTSGKKAHYKKLMAKRRKKP